jgi:hypothetical protein
MKEQIKCNVCGSDLTNTETNASVAGMTISISTDRNIHSTEVEFNRVQNMFGQTEFNICYCCLIKAMGVKPKESIPMIPVTSSQIKSVGYRDNTLFIEFTKGSVYSYANVPETFFEALKKAESVGKYFASEIKGKFEFTKTDKVVVNEEIK